MKNARFYTTLLIILPYIFLLFEIIGIQIIEGTVFFWVLFCLTLFPFSIATLIIHFFLGRSRRKNNLEINKWDDTKIAIAILGSFAGLMLWGLWIAIIG
jgi:hypothetical protein